MSLVTREDRAGIAVLSVNNPPVNAISLAVRTDLLAAVRAAGADPDIQAIVIACAGRTFMAGSDIREFDKPPVAPVIGDVIQVIEDLDMPVVAALHGTALGGGFEVALGCHYRVALASARVGLPEVTLGLIPGAGGTQRLPRLIGAEKALDAILSGRHIPAPKALALGALDRVIDGDLVDGAVAFAREVVGQPVRRTGALPVAPVDTQVFTAARQRIAKRKRGYRAPPQAIDVVEAACSLPFAEGIALEREVSLALKLAPESQALRHQFFAARQLSRVPGLDQKTPRRSIERVGIIGAGTMGGGIAMAFANAGLPGTLLDMSSDALEKGLRVVRGNYDISAKKGRLSAADVDDRMALLTGTCDYADLADCDLIIEAVFEKMALKKEIFADLDRVAKPGAILATNTSYLDVNEIAASCRRPGDVIGLHFFSPANVMKLLEIVRGEATAPDVLATCVDLAKRIGKVGVVAGVCFGFIGNRMLNEYRREALLSVIGGSTPEAVDRVLYDFGFAMGPLAVTDMAGLDIGYMSRKAMGRDAYDTRAYDWIDRIVEAGRKGLKAGAGIYAYAPGSRTPLPDPEVAAIIVEEATKAGVERRAVDDTEIRERCLYALVNEGAKILGEGIALRASDIDIVYVNGYGFPAYRGGPMHYADQIGLAHVLARIGEFAGRYGDRWWQPAPLLVELVASGRTFKDYDAAP